MHDVPDGQIDRQTDEHHGNSANSCGLAVALFLERSDVKRNHSADRMCNFDARSFIMYTCG